MIWGKNFGKMIKEERLSWGMSRGRLQKLSHVDRETIADIENGKTYLKNDSLLKLVSLYNVPINELCNLSCHCDAIMKLEKILKHLKDNNIDLPESYF